MVSISKKESDWKSYYTENIILGFVESPLFKNSSGKVDRIEKDQPQQKIATPLESIEIPRLSRVQRLLLRVGFVIELRILQSKNYGPTVFFLRHCRKHGVIATYPQGYLGKLRCYKCLESRRKNHAHDL